jgi:hypothetical protein
MGHETYGDSVEELENIERMLVKKIADLDARREIMVNELRLVREKKERLAKGGA